MTDRELRSYLAGQRLMDGYQIMRKVIDNGETAIIPRPKDLQTEVRPRAPALIEPQVPVQLGNSAR